MGKKKAKSASVEKHVVLGWFALVIIMFFSAYNFSLVHELQDQVRYLDELSHSDSVVYSEKVVDCGEFLIHGQEAVSGVLRNASAFVMAPNSTGFVGDFDSYFYDRSTCADITSGWRNFTDYRNVTMTLQPLKTR